MTILLTVSGFYPLLITWPDHDSNPGPLEHYASTLTTELPSRMINLWQFPRLIRFVPESARNHAGTDEPVPLRLVIQARTHTGHQM